MTVGRYEYFGRCVDRCESPIERAFLMGFLFATNVTFMPIHHGDAIARDGTGIELRQQVKVGKYRLDFALTHPDAKIRIAIELDGWEFHGTKDRFVKDKARERAIVLRGWTVLRFAGSEVFADPQRCAQEALLAAALIVDSLKGAPVPEAVRPELPIPEMSWDEQVSVARVAQRAARLRLGIAAE